MIVFILDRLDLLSLI